MQPVKTLMDRIAWREPSLLPLRKATREVTHGSQDKGQTTQIRFRKTFLEKQAEHWSTTDPRQPAAPEQPDQYETVFETAGDRSEKEFSYPVDPGMTPNPL